MLIYTYHSTRRLFAVTRVYLQFNAARLFLFCSGLRLTLNILIRFLRYVKGCFVLPRFYDEEYKKMTELEKLLQNWNNGVLRGAKIRLARELKVDDSTVSAWVAGRANPPADKVEKISKLFKISEKEVKKAFGIEDKEFSRSLRVTPLTDKNTISLPILADVPAGLPEFSEADVETFWDIPRWVFPGADFVVKCNGDSLEPKLHLGDYCVIRKTEEPLNGRAMVVKTELGICMKVIKKLPDGTIQLCSTNPKYKPFIPEELTIVGLIIGHWRRDDKENWNSLTEE